MKVTLMMTKNFKVFVLTLLFAAASCSFTTKDPDPGKDKLLISLISYVLERGHYDARDFNDEFSEEVYDDYLQMLDPLKRYFFASDIAEFSKYRDQLDDQIKNEDITFFDLTYERLRKRIEESREIYEDVLNEPFIFSEDEYINTDYDAIEYVSNKREMKERWKQQLKFNTIGTYYDKMQEGKSDAQITPEEVEKEAREATKNSLEEYFSRTEELERKDYFALYVNAIVEEFDPHTQYMAPRDKDFFDMTMSGQFQGIGARLQKRTNDITITEIISGGPAWRSEELEEGDVILKVKQEEDEVATSIVGMRLDDAVELIKGPKGTIVTLNVKKKDGTIESIDITRDVVQLEETYAKSVQVQKDDRNYGVIQLPGFYFNMENSKERNAATDVKQEIIRLKEQNVEGIVLDLRNNGGGSLSTVVDIAGMFIEEGPVVQVKYKDQNREVLRDKDKSILWDGPLVILVNEISASASEILAAAMQDYKRAVIIGSKQTYGKGTVQTVYDLNKWLHKNDLGDMGALKVTVQKFYRINGGSTQLEGVKSDVVVKDKYSYIDLGEKNLNNPLPYDQIEPAAHKTWDGYIDYEQTIKNSQNRMAKSEQLRLIEENAKWIKGKQDDAEWPLNYEAYKAKVAQNEKEAERFDKIGKYKSTLKYNSLPYEVALFEQDTTLREKRDRWHDNLAKDVYVEEAINVLEDLRTNNIKRGDFVDVKD
ncbi:MAG: carboxy terminal-processing peptidase [Leeuwenhoekiella sp.]